MTSRSARNRRAIIVGVLGVVAGVGLVYGFTVLANRGEVDVRLGDDVFAAGRTDSLSTAIERDGPFLVPDASPRQERDIYVQHLSADQDEGWSAFSAQAPGAERECALQWDGEVRDFADPCSGRRYPADGEGLTQYPVTVTDGRITVDLRQP